MARPATLALLWLLAASALVAQSQESQNFERLFLHALDLQKAGDLLGAIEDYKAALAIVPDRADALSNLGAAYVSLGQYDDGIREYEAALKSDPAANPIRLNLALAYYKSARPNQAIPQLKRIIASDPDTKAAYLVLADCYLQTGQDQELVALLKPREALFADKLTFAYLLGTGLLHIGDEAEGQKYIDRIFGAGESAEAHLLMATALLERKDYPEAKTELKRALQLNPRLPTAHALYGRALLALGEQELAEGAFFEELALNVNDFEANLQLGNVRRNMNRLGEAATYLERASAIRPNDLTARKLLATVRMQTGRTEEAVTLLESIAKEAPDIVEVHVQLATAYNRLKRRDDAQREKEIVDRLNAQAQAKQSGKGQ